MTKRLVVWFGVLVLLTWIGWGCGSESDTEPAKPYQKVNLSQQWISNEAKTPRNVHLSWQHSPATTMTITWTTDFTDTSSYVPRVWFVKDSPELTAETDEGISPAVFADEFVAEGTGETYKEEMSTKASPTFVAWSVELTGLEPNTRYYYRVGTWESFDESTGEFVNPNLSDPHWFITANEASAQANFKFVAAGDSRGGYDQIAENIEVYTGLNAQFWVFNGDFTDFGTQREWNQWFEAMQPLLYTTPFMPVTGNHEIFESVYYTQFVLPASNAVEGCPECSWSFNYGNAHFVGLNTNTRDVVNAQLNWLRSDLSQANNNPNIVWKFVLMHHPAYSSSHHGCTDYVQELLVPIFEEFGVDLVFSGHDHDYERSHPICNGEICETGGVIYVVVGAFFAPPYDAGSDWWTAVSRDGDDGNFAVIEIDGKTLTFTAYTGDGSEVIDSFTLTK